MSLTMTPARRVGLLSSGVLLIGSPFAAYVGLAPQIEGDWGLSTASSALLYSAYLCGAALAALLILPRTTGGPPALVRSSVALVATAHLAMSVAPGPLSAAASRIVAGGAYIVAYYGAVQWIAKATPPANRGRSIGILVAAGYAGTSASYLLVAAVLAGGLGWRLGYGVVSSPAIVGIGAVWLALSGTTTAACRPPALERRTPDWRGIGGFRVGRIIIGYAAHTAELYVARFWVPYALIAVLAADSTSATGAGAYLASGLLFAAGVPGPYLGGWLGDRIGTGRAAGGVLAAGGILALLLLWSAEQPFLFIPLALVYCAVLPADSAVLTSGVTLYAAPRSLGAAQALQATSGFVAGAALPALVGVLVESASSGGAWRVALAENAVVALLASTLVVGVGRLSDPPG